MQFTRNAERRANGAGRKHDVPLTACYESHAGDCYVWVTPDGVEALSRLTLDVLDIATLDPNPLPEEPTKTVQAYFYKEDGKLDRIETSTNPTAAGATSTRPKAGYRKDFYNPLQSQIQMGASGGKK